MLPTKSLGTIITEFCFSSESSPNLTEICFLSFNVSTLLFEKECISIMEISTFKIAFQISIPKTILVSQHSHNDKAKTQTNVATFHSL